MKRIPLTEAYRRFSAIVSKLGEGPISLTRRGKQVAVLLTPEGYESLRQAADVSLARPPVTREYIQQLRGSLKGGNALTTLMREREWERSRDE